MTLRPYQVAAVKAVQRAIEQGEDPLVVMPTGTGKTTVFAELVKRESSRGCVLVVAHRVELIEQAAARIEAWCGRRPAIEMAEREADPQRDWCIVGSVQSVAARLDRYPRGSVALLIVDEAHHAGASTYRTIASRLGCPVVGVTATPERADGEGLAFTTVAYQYPILDAIRDRHLVDVRAVAVDLSIDPAALKRAKGKGADYTDESMAAAMAEHIGEMAGAIAQLREGRPTVVFAASVDQAHDLAETLRGLGVRAGSADGTTDKAVRAELLRAYERGEVEALCNYGLWTEGWDAPHTACVAVCRPTRSRGLYMQMLGRGLRPSEGKRDCLAIDFGGKADGLGLADAYVCLAGEWSDEVIREARASDKPASEALREAVDIVEAREVAKRSKAAAKAIDVWGKRGEKRPVQAELFGLTISDRGGPPSEKQTSLIAKLGLAVPDGKVGASQVIDWALGRRAKGLCSVRQAAILARYGLPIDVTFARASELIDAIAQNRWRVPHGLVA